jgi:hypothetical protein
MCTFSRQPTSRDGTVYSTPRIEIVPERVTVTVARLKSVVRNRGSGRIACSSSCSSGRRRAFFARTNSARNA